jgi:hypothetical protein
MGRVLLSIVVHQVAATRARLDRLWRQLYPGSAEIVNDFYAVSEPWVGILGPGPRRFPLSNQEKSYGLEKMNLLKYIT